MNFSPQLPPVPRQGRDKIMKTELMDAVQGLVAAAKQNMQGPKAESGIVPSPASLTSQKTPTAASVRTEAILALLSFCDRGGKQLIGAYPMLGPRKG